MVDDCVWILDMHEQAFACVSCMCMFIKHTKNTYETQNMFCTYT